jgi:hypothetical protein
MMSDWVHLPLPNRPSDPEFNFNDYAYEPWSQAGLNPDVVRLRLDGIRHMGYTDLILLLDGPEHESRFGTVPPAIAIEATGAASLAFLDQYLKDGHRKALDDVIERTPVTRSTAHSVADPRTTSSTAEHAAIRGATGVCARSSLRVGAGSRDDLGLAPQVCGHRSVSDAGC